MSRKLGFWAVLSLVIGSQIGSGVLLLPTTLATFGYLSFVGWVFSGTGAISLALVFSNLSNKFPKTGGPHVFVQEAFGKNFAFFTAWTYWVISWVSSTAVVKASIGYLMPIIGDHGPMVNLGLEIGLLFVIAALNLKGVKAAGSMEFILSIIKIVPLFVLAIVGIFYFDSKNLTDISELTKDTSTLLNSISKVTLLTLWGFIGLESATASAESVENPCKTIPRAVILGTVIVAVIYIINSIGVMGVIESSVLKHSKAPYAETAKVLFGGNWHLLVSVIAFIICVGTLNAWMLASGQIALGGAEDKLLPRIFAKRNDNDSPYVAIIISALGIVPLLICAANNNFASSVNYIIDVSVVSFLFVYIICILSLIKIKSETHDFTMFERLYSSFALIFCLWVISTTEFSTLLAASLFTLSGVFVLLGKKLIK